MSKHFSKKRRLKYVMLAAACTVTFSLTGIAAACSKTTENTEDEKTTSKEDTQLLRNGNFEFFTVPEQKKDCPAPVYLISTPDDWTHGGTSSYTMSGIIGTSKTAWEKMSDDLLADNLDYNNALVSGDSNYDKYYVDYNGMKSSDIPYKDTYAALQEIEDDDESDHSHDKDLIANPGTRYNVTEENGKLYAVKDGEKVEVYEDENGDYFFDEDFKEPFSHVLMLHNYATSHNGIAQNYSSVSIDLPANTAAEISVWVKTSDLLFHQGTEVTQDRGAFISVTQTVGGSTLDDFTISNINTQKLIEDEVVSDENNGWIEYTVYVKACDFAASTVSLKLGLGEDNYTVEGYAFFDDVNVTKYVSLDDDNCSYKDYETAIYNNEYRVDEDVVRKAYCTISSDASEKIFKADKYSRNGGSKQYDRFSDCFHYLIDLASETEYNKVTFSNNLKAGLTVDENDYVSSGSATNNKFYSNYDGALVGIDSADVHGGVKLPSNFTALKTNYDLLACVNAGYTFSSSDPVRSKYYEQINNALSGVTDLPNCSSDSKVLVTFSAYGAAYTTSFELTIEDGGYQIISFWVKTSDMNGNTAATVKITEKDNDDNTANVVVDSTGIVTDIDEDNPDIYNGWVQCFFFVKNEDTEAKTLTIDLSFGNTNIKDTADSSYKAGWIALANMQTLSVDEDTFSYTGSGDYTASLTISETDDPLNSVFDEVYGSQKHEIENDIVNPSSYSGVNGGSSYVVNNGHVSIPYDDINTNNYAGLINKEYFVNGNYENNVWFNSLVTNFNASSTDALTNWNTVFGNKSVQPLIIVNKLRQDYVEIKGADETTYKNYLVKNDDGEFVAVGEDEEYDETKKYYSRKDVLNYGFIGTAQTVSANSYKTVSVKVKVSRGAVAYVYLIDTTAGKDVMQFKAPSYTFYYDTDGNVLKAAPDEKATLAQQRANILYSLRDDGLYEDENGKLFANVYNYKKLYTDETIEYYDADGVMVSFDKLVDGESYYDKNGNLLDHYLVTSSGVKIYEYVNGKYHYIVEGKTQSEEVNPFDTQYARYDYSKLSENDDTNYYVVLDGNDADIAGKWITLNFVIHAGSESKSYRLELWSGERENAFTDGNEAGGSVIFDYSYTSVTDDTLRDEYENEIILAYQKLLISNGITSFATSTENICYYEQLVKENKLEDEIGNYEILKNYTAYYYTYSLFDSADFQPFNKNTADDDATGYAYSVEDYTEALAYLKVIDGDVYTVFADYSTIDQSISLDSATDDEETETEDNDNSNVWLLISSIVLVFALLFAMIAILLKDMIKKARRGKVTSKNNYDHQKANRYMRRRIRKEDNDGESAESVENDEQPAETENADAEPEETTESAESVENDEQPAEEDVSTEQPAEEPVEDETPSNDGQE